MADARSKQILLGVAVLIVFAAAFQIYLSRQGAIDELNAAREAVESALTVEENPGLALRESIDRLKEHPGDPHLLILQGRAYHQLKRYSDAIAALEEATSSARGDQLEEAQFYLARAQTRRFLDTGGRDDFNLAEASLAALQGGEFDEAVSVLLGLAYARESDSQDLDEARRLLKVLDMSRDIEGLDDEAGARQVRSGL